MSTFLRADDKTLVEGKEVVERIFSEHDAAPEKEGSVPR
jgi:hypothetical protein